MTRKKVKSSSQRRHCKKCLGCQEVTPVATIRTDNGSNPVSHEMDKFWTIRESNTRRQFHCGRGRTEKLNGRINRYLIRRVRHKLKENHGNKNFRNIFLRTGQHLTPRLESALPSYYMDGKSDPKCQSSNAIKRRKGEVSLISSR